MDYRVLKILNESTLLLITPNGKEHKMKINDVKLSMTLELVENAWNTFLNSRKTYHESPTYMSSITTTSLPTHIKHLHQPLEFGAALLVHTEVQHLPYTVVVSALHLQQLQTLQTMTSSASMTQQTLPRPTITNVSSGKE